MTEFAGRTAVVTGGGSGMGQEVVRQLVAALQRRDGIFQSKRHARDNTVPNHEAAGRCRDEASRVCCAAAETWSVELDREAFEGMWS